MSAIAKAKGFATTEEVHELFARSRDGLSKEQAQELLESFSTVNKEIKAQQAAKYPNSIAKIFAGLATMLQVIGCWSPDDVIPDLGVYRAADGKTVADAYVAVSQALRHAGLHVPEDLHEIIMSCNLIAINDKGKQSGSGKSNESGQGAQIRLAPSAQATADSHKMMFNAFKLEQAPLVLSFGDQSDVLQTAERKNLCEVSSVLPLVAPSLAQEHDQQHIKYDGFFFLCLFFSPQFSFLFVLQDVSLASDKGRTHLPVVHKSLPLHALRCPVCSFCQPQANDRSCGLDVCFACACAQA